MLTPQSDKIQYTIHIQARFCELQPNQRVLKCLYKILRFQPALYSPVCFFVVSKWL